MLPLGISFYTLQAVSYVVDVYRGRVQADRNLGRVALFLVFFPQIMEGPIGRYDKLAFQLYEDTASTIHGLNTGDSSFYGACSRKWSWRTARVFSLTRCSGRRA